MVLEFNRAIFLFIVSIAVSIAISYQAIAADVQISGLVVTAIDQIEVPARATGVVDRLLVREGDSVTLGQTLAKLDDAQAVIESSRAGAKLKINQSIANSELELDLAKKVQQQSEQVARGHELASEIAHRKGTNNIRILAAQKAEAVANNELQRAAAARAAFADSVSRSEIDGLTLALQRSQLETKQATFDRQIDGLSAQGEDATATELQLAIDTARLGVEKASADRSIASLTAESTLHDAELAALAVRRHQVNSPIDGVVLRIHRRPGQWVQIGEPVVEVVRLDRLRATGFVSQQIAGTLRQGAKVRLVPVNGAGKPASLVGEVVFIKPQVDPVNGEVEFWVEFDNLARTILPGMQVGLQLDAI